MKKEMKKSWITALAAAGILAGVALPSTVNAEYVLRNNWLVEKQYAATLPAEDHFRLGIEAAEKKEWEEAARQFRIVCTNFPDSAEAGEVEYYAGKSYYHAGEYDVANTYLSGYLSGSSFHKYFYEAIRYKFLVAEKFSQGHKRHVMGWEKMPKIVSGYEDAIEIYDEIIAALPHHDMTARSLYGKAVLLKKMKKYRESDDALQKLITTFYHHELIPHAHVALAEVYAEQCRYQAQNTDILDQARLNIKKFKGKYQRDERIKDAEKLFGTMQETHAEELCKIGELYERKKKCSASVIYYASVLKKYPHTKAAKNAKERLKDLKKFAIPLNIPEELWQ
jgi:outer membrane protein assembly factor BamD (BamD/ComL family)